jgi:hypothetical protein
MYSNEATNSTKVIYSNEAIGSKNLYTVTKLQAVKPYVQ